jgi:hypothetical protein
MRKLAVGLLLLTTVYNSAFCQAGTQDTSRSYQVNHSDKGAFVVNGGIGYSTIFLVIEGALPIKGASVQFPTSISPVINVTADYNFINDQSIGLCFAYQKVGDVPQTENTSLTNYTESITRTNIALRYLFHFVKNSNSDTYIGTRLGLSFWVDGVLPLSSQQYAQLAMGRSSFVLPSLQLLFGYRHYFSNTFGIHIELGLGTPYLAEAGITFRIAKK